MIEVNEEDEQSYDDNVAAIIQGCENESLN